MNLKEAFRFQNKLRNLQETAAAILGCDSNVTQVKQTYLRKKVMPEAENETTVSIPETDYADRITELTSFVMWLLTEREKLCHAIREAKNKLPIDMDSEIGLNAARQEAAQLFGHLRDLRSTEVVLTNGGVGYRFNADGNQVSYKCDVRRVTTINFDRNVVREYAANLNQKSNEVSSAIDRCVVTSDVDYIAPFDVNDSFAGVFDAFCQQ